MEQFLIQFSTIPRNFIVDFFMIAKEEYTDNELIINFTIICKWLDVNKSDLKKVLLKNFEENFDYTIEKKKKLQVNSRGANIYEEILITPNCFKEICMVSQSANAKKVRKYFIEMEKLIKRYFLTIKENMYKKIGVLETNSKPKINISGGVIYILRALNTDVTVYKLGKTKNLNNRLKTYNTGNANNIEPLFILPVKDITSVESCIKTSCKKFQYRKYKEVYEIDINVLKEVMVDCSEFVDKMANKLQDKLENKKFKSHITRMKKKIDKYFIYLDKEN